MASTSIKSPRQSPVAKEMKMKTQKHGKSSQPYQVMFYHVLDSKGRHRFLTMNSLTADWMGGKNVFEARLGEQFKSYELLGTMDAITSENGRTTTIVDRRGAEQTRERVQSAMAAHPNSYLEPWLPNSEMSAGQVPTATDNAHWRPMSTFKKGVGKVDFERISFVFQGADLRNLVKPECVAEATARGRVLFREFKDEVKKNVEAQFMRLMDDPNDSAEAPGPGQDLGSSGQRNGIKPN